MVCSVVGNAVGYVTTVNGGWNFRVSAVAGFSIGDTCTFSGLEVEAASLANSNGDLVYEARRQAGGTLVDQDVNDTSFSIVSQFALTEDQKLNGVINVYDDRLSFVDAETVAAGRRQLRGHAELQHHRRRGRHHVRGSGRDDGRRCGDDQRRFRVG